MQARYTRVMLDKPWQPTTPVTYRAKESRTIGDLFLRQVAARGDALAFQHKENGRWVETSWSQFCERSSAIAGFLMSRGIALGDKICIIGSTGPEWCYADIGGHLAGAVTLGAYPTSTPRQLAYILDHSDSKIAFVEGAATVETLLGLRDELPKLECVVVWNGDDIADKIAADDWLISLDEVLAHGGEREPIDERQASIAPRSTAIIIYTSGTTGPPKGAMISHHNVLSCLQLLESNVPTDLADMGLTFLPMAHAAERVAGLYGRINGGMATSFASNIPSVLEEIQEIKPTLFGSVPRIFEKAYAKMMGRVEDAPPTRQKIFRWAERTGRAVVKRWQRGEPVPLVLRLQYHLADRLVFSKLRDIFGGRVRRFVTGAAPIADEILEFFWAAGFPIYEVYGMTECTVITHSNRPGQIRLGSVGKALAGIEDRIADDGEILIRGDLVFLGYYKNEAATAETIDEDGWLHTGDIGEKDADGYLYIRDRKKHIIITAGGKNLTPANIENELKAADPLISQAHAHGDKRPYLTALVTIGPAEAVEYARAHGLAGAGECDRIVAALAANPLARPPGLGDLMARVTEEERLRQRIVAAVQRANRQLSRVETIKKVHLLEREFSIEEDELTPTLKVKRKNIENKFADIFERLYEDADFGLSIESRGGG